MDASTKAMDEFEEALAKDGETPSPFLPGTKIQFAWDSTSLGYLKQCPRLYQYCVIDGWKPKGESDDLKFGIEYHQALYDYDLLRACGVEHNDAIHDVVRALLTRTYDWRTNHQYKNRSNLVRSVIWYLDQFEDDPAKTLILNNGAPACELSFRFELDFGPTTTKLVGKQVWDSGNQEMIIEPTEVTETIQPYLLCGHLDRVVEFQGEIYGMDRKTTRTTPGAYYFDGFDPHNQMTLYSFALRVIFESPIRGVIIDSAQIAVDFTRFTRGFTYRTEDRIDEWIYDLEHWLAQAEGYAIEGYWPQNDTACDKYGGCRFREVCSKSPSVRDMFLQSDFEKGEPWNPLKVR